MRIAIIDLGTNTFNLLISEINNQQPTTLYKTKIPVKLGQGGIDKNIISADAFERGIEALIKQKKSIEFYKADKIFAFATSAIRSASNGKEFVVAVKDKVDIDIEVISGEKEAELIFYGVKKAINLPNKNLLIMDIGGGSTEFIIANNNTILWKESYNLGVSRIKEIFKPSDPIKNDEIEKVISFLTKELEPLSNALQKYSCDTLIGSSGSFESFADMLAYKYNKPGMLKGATSYQFNIKDVINLNDSIHKTSYIERLKIPGLIEMRADMIVLAGIFIDFIISHINAKEVYLSKYALKEGALYSLLQKEKMA